MILLAGVLFASLLGSVHCGAMCSVFACMANGTSRRGAWYHGGRLSAYVTLGAAAGALGSALDSAGLIAHVQRSAALVAGAALVVWGAVQLRQAVRARRFGGATQWGGALGRLLSRTAAWDPRARATAIGVTTGLLPCGWLWAFIATAMGTGSPLTAMLVMAVFWIGTLPMLLTVTAGVRRFGPMATVRWPLASASLVIALGIGELAAHLFMPAMTPELRATHVHASTP